MPLESRRAASGCEVVPGGRRLPERGCYLAANAREVAIAREMANAREAASACASPA